MEIISSQDITVKNCVPYIIWCYWEGEEMRGNRKLSYEYLVKNIQVPIFLITPENLSSLIKPEAPLPEEYNYLSAVHRSDYIRAYMMHYYGGGWHDIKATTVSYKDVWEEFSDENTWIVGRPEVAKGAAKVTDEWGNYMPNHYRDLIAVPSWVVRPKTALSLEILNGMNRILKINAEKLKSYPAKHNRECKLQANNWFKKLLYTLKFLYQGRSIHYPIEWTYFGNQFHPAILKYKEHVSFNLPVDSIKNAGIKHRN